MTKHFADLGCINVAIKGIENIEEHLKKHNGEDALISIFHKLYGNQKIQCKFDCIIDKERIGFRVKSGQEIYMLKKDIVDYQLNCNIRIVDDVMEVFINFQC